MDQLPIDKGYSPYSFAYFVRGKCWPLILALAEKPRTAGYLKNMNVVSEKTVDDLLANLVSGHHAQGGVGATVDSKGVYTLHPTPFTWKGYGHDE